MDLDELKSQLNHRLATDHSDRSADDFAELLQKRTNSIVGKLKRSLLFEIKSGIIFVLVFTGIGIFSHHPVFKAFFSLFAVVILVTNLVLFYLYRTTNRVGDDPLPVKENLETVVRIIEAFIKWCFQLALILIPVSVLLIVLLQYRYRDTHPAVAFNFAENRWFTSYSRVAWFIAVYCVVFVVVMYYFAKWYLQKMYGKYIAQLKECIAELEE